MLRAFVVVLPPSLLPKSLLKYQLVSIRGCPRSAFGLRGILVEQKTKACGIKPPPSLVALYHRHCFGRQKSFWCDRHTQRGKEKRREREKAGGEPIIRRHQFFVRWSERIQTFRQKGEERCHQLQSSMAMSSPPSSDIWAWSRPLSSAVRLTLQDCMSSSRSSRRRCIHTRLLLPPLTFGVVLRILCSS